MRRTILFRCTLSRISACRRKLFGVRKKDLRWYWGTVSILISNVSGEHFDVYVKTQRRFGACVTSLFAAEPAA